ncbi:class I SAM-dependent methyltransferase [Sphingomonas sp. KR3-1]|uniref:O-methyltransferase n=1 Tax=Sphingomonas sp. KR3-1 TaxID=3156611 RepID=UPI0032B5AA7C
MTTLTDAPVAGLLETLHREATATDEAHFRAMMDKVEAQDGNIDALVANILAEERADLTAVYRGYAGNFLAVSPVFGRFLYAMARARNAKRIVEFGTSMGVSAIYLAAALRDNGGGMLIGSEIEPAKAARARAHLEAAGLADLVEIREGNALETLADPGGPVDLLLVDGAFSLYLPVLKLIEPHLAPGAVILGENAFDPAYQDYVRNPANGYVSQPLPVDEGRGNEFTVRIAA